MLVKILTSALLATFGLESYQQAQTLVKDADVSGNEEFVSATIKPIQFTLIVLSVGRPFLLMAALKYKWLLKSFFYYESVIEMLGHFLAQKAYADADLGTVVWMLVTLLNFTMLYTNIKFALPVSVLSLLTFLIGTRLTFGSEHESGYLALKSFMLLNWLVVSLMIIHLLNFSAGAD